MVEREGFLLPWAPVCASIGAECTDISLVVARSQAWGDDALSASVSESACACDDCDAGPRLLSL